MGADNFRYWVFCGDCYYPSGGMDDLEGKFPTLEEAKAFMKGFIGGNYCRWGHIYDSESGAVIHEGE